MEVKMEQLSSLISKDMAIGDVIKNYPEIMPTLQENGIQCIGCHLSPYETLEQGFSGHGKTQEEINNILNKLNDMIKTHSLNNESEVYFTDKAIQKFIDIKTKENQTTSFLKYNHKYKFYQQDIQ